MDSDVNARMVNQLSTRNAKVKENSISKQLYHLVHLFLDLSYLHS